MKRFAMFRDSVSDQPLFINPAFVVVVLPVADDANSTTIKTTSGNFVVKGEIAKVVTTLDNMP